MSEWISVRNQLPYEGERVIVCWKFDIGGSNEKHIDIATYMGSGIWSLATHKRVANWMPLPETPKENAK